MIPSVLPTYTRAPLHFVKGEGTWLVEEDGRRFLDLGSGIAVNALGHAHPALVAALTEQAGNLWHVSNLYEIPQQQALADKLVAATFADTVFFTNSGTESCELAVKMARKYWYDKGQPEKTDIIAFEGAFHGRSSAGIAAAGSEKMIKGFGPVLPGFKHVPWGDHDALHAAIDEATGAILIEPVQGEGGIRPLPDHCLKGLRELCDEKGILLILDEVQCGMGRTGRLFAHEWAGISPDIMMVAKGIGGGFPLGAVLATEEAASGMTAGTHGSTYGGNPLGCAVGCAVMDHVADEAFLSDVNRKAGLLRQKLESLVAAHPEVFEGNRGMGLMLGLKCKLPPADLVRAGYDALVITVPAADNVLRLLPPLTITEDEIGEAVARLDTAAGAVTPSASSPV
ncbi:MAG: aspartate aminotransferase family protein [Rhodobacteraceae bacterium]|jgi:acetylornithine/N-succinyldiaminopimelate aminotransferase|uniref:Acetylornithine aminotransferase n=1 Tax=Salipiger profundus TaxID=1229727 RepID=A0A1U7D6I1_9RHOB|nr:MULTISPECIES: aspartate aminotransferase family protein [Salipiger]APX23718.1 acetylornithine aminotransferase apoenzyme [Salipiger profundus]MAB07124.1 aspartate aminotransferase family protein [Paracoccaceae bacterium]GGA17454.1 acetylornithine aminotransferase [Salipiger profundus]SFD30929.1 acetylornithine aminotransferase apoenzyme [Salipiger profundus]